MWAGTIQNKHHPQTTKSINKKNTHPETHAFSQVPRNPQTQPKSGKKKSTNFDGLSTDPIAQKGQKMRFCEKGSYHWWRNLRRANRGGWREEGNRGDDRLRGWACGRGRRRWWARVAAAPRRRSRARRVANPGWPSSRESCGLGHRSASAPRRTPPCRPSPPATPPPC